jgi:hypothetical protein
MNCEKIGELFERKGDGFGEGNNYGRIEVERLHPSGCSRENKNRYLLAQACCIRRHFQLMYRLRLPVFCFTLAPNAAVILQ